MNGLNLIERLEDLKISGWTGKNLDDTAALGKFLKLVNEGSIPKGTVLICENLDRLTRGGIFDALNLFSNILKAGIDIVTTMDNKRYSYESVKNNVGELIISITYLTRGNNESETKSLRVKESWKNRRANVRNGTFAKFPCPSWLEHDGKAYSPKPEAAKAIRLIFELYVSGIGTSSVIKELNMRGIKPFTKTGKWNLVFIHELLKNPAVIGTYALIEPAVKNYFPAIIPEDMFYKALAQRQSNTNFKGSHGVKEINIFGGLTKCHICGSSMVKYSCKGNSKNTKNKTYTFLICSQAKIGKCSYKFVNLDKLQETFTNVFHSDYFVSFIQSKTEKTVADKSPEIQGRLLELEKTIGRVADSVVKTASKALEARLGALEVEKATLGRELEQELIRVKSATNSNSSYYALLKDFKKHLASPDFRLSLRGFMRNTIAKIVCSPDTYSVHFKNTADTIKVEFTKAGYRYFVNDTMQFRIIDDLDVKDSEPVMTGNEEKIKASLAA